MALGIGKVAGGRVPSAECRVRHLGSQKESKHTRPRNRPIGLKCDCAGLARHLLREACARRSRAAAVGSAVLPSSGITGISRESPPVWIQSYSKTIIMKFDVRNFRFRRLLSFFRQKAKRLERGQFPSLQRLSPSSSFKIDGKICQRNLTRIDRTIKNCSARRIYLVLSDDGAWVTIAVSAKIRTARAVHPFNAIHCNTFASSRRRSRR